MSFEKPKSVSQQEQKTEENLHIAVALRSASVEKIANFLKNGNREQKRICTEIDQEIALIDQKIISRESALHATNDTAGGMTTKKGELETYQKEKNVLMAKREEYADEVFENIDQQSLRDYIEARKGENINGKKEELQELQKEIVRLQGIVGAENRYDSKKQFDASDVAQGKFEGEKRKLAKYEQDAQRLSDDIEESEKIGLILSLLGERAGNEDVTNEEKKTVDESVTSAQKESRDTDMDEVNKFDREVQRRENMEVEADVAKFQKEWNDIAAAKKEAYDGRKTEIRHEKIEEMRAILAQKRELFVRKDMAINTALAKLRKLPWNKGGNMAAQEEVQVFRRDYESAFKALENFLLDNYHELSPEDRKNLVQDIVEGRNMEMASLQEQRTQIKSESMPIMQKHLPTFSKWARNKNVQKALAVGSIGLGAISGSVRTAFSMAPKIALKLGAGETTMSALKFTAAASKFLAPIGAGVAVGMGTAKLFEKWQKSRFEKEKSAEKKAFAEMTEEEQFLHLMDFDHGTIVNDAKRLEAISGNAKLAGLITGAIAGGSVFMLMGGDAHGAEDVVKNDGSVDQAFLDRAGKPLLDIEPKIIDSADVEAALRDGSVTEAWLNKYTSYNDHIAEFQSQGFQDTQAYADFQKEYDTEAFKKFVEEHPNTPRQEVINNWEKGMIARSNMIADRVQLERGAVSVSQDVQEEINAEQSEDHETAQPEAAKSSVVKEQSAGSTAEAFKGVSIFIEKGGSVQGALTRFLEDDGVKLPEVMSTWKDASVRDLAKHALTLNRDSQEYHDAIHKLAEIRSSVLANEFARSHPGIDLSIVQPDTRLILDTRNLEDIKLDIDFKDGPHIVPEKTKIEFPQETAEAHVTEIAKELYTKDDIQRMFGMNGEQYEFLNKAPADQYFREIQHVNSDKAQLPLDKVFIKLVNEKHIDLSGKTVMEVLRENNIESVTNVSDVVVPETVSQTASITVHEDAHRALAGMNLDERPLIDRSGRFYSKEFATYVQQNQNQFGDSAQWNPQETVRQYADRMEKLARMQQETGAQLPGSGTHHELNISQSTPEEVAKFRAPFAQDGVRRSPHAAEFFSPKEGTRVMSTGFSFAPDTPAGDIAKELTERGVDKEFAQKLASEYKDDTSVFGDAMEKRQAMMKLNMKLRDHLESSGKSFYDTAREVSPGHDAQPASEQGQEKIMRRSPQAREFMQSGTDALHNKARLSQDFAEKMGEKDIFNVKAKFQGGVPTEINGKPVPEELYTSEQLQRVRTARHLNDLMSQGENAVHARDAVSQSADISSAERGSDVVYERMSEPDLIRTLRNQEGFDQQLFMRSVGTKIQDTFGLPSLASVRNVANAKVELFRGIDNVTVTPGFGSVQQRLESVVARATEEYGEKIGAPKRNETIQTYFTRIAARAELTGDADKIFHS